MCVVLVKGFIDLILRPSSRDIFIKFEVRKYASTLLCSKTRHPDSAINLHIICSKLLYTYCAVEKAGNNSDCFYSSFENVACLGRIQTKARAFYILAVLIKGEHKLAIDINIFVNMSTNDIQLEYLRHKYS